MVQQKTITFLGSDKNAGKTTAFIFYLRSCRSPFKYIVTSIGINGESLDEYEYHQKPQILLKAGQYFVSKQSRLSQSNGYFETIQIFNQPSFKDVFVLAKATVDCFHVLEGPNSKSEVQLLQSKLAASHPSFSLLIDGSIDRQFLCDPSVSDEIYYSLLITNRPAQRLKAKQLLITHQFEISNLDIASMLQSYRVILFDQNQNTIYKSMNHANFDDTLFEKIEHNLHPNSILYLNCALSQKLLNHLKNRKIKIVLNNPSLLVSNLSNELTINYQIELLKKSTIKKVFIKEDSPGFLKEFDILHHYKFHNLFQEEHHEIQL
ncbi:MAG: hypothetical protein KC646_08965 [Candidatus Cloacimonetes bacterium]|nr:hypothetical protein [Candidatus Cloacimonadota bacterium]